MSERNRSSVGFGTAALFHLTLLISGVFLQNLYVLNRTWFQIALIVGGLGAAGFGYFYRGFLRDLFSSFKSAAVLITMLVLACVLGTFIIQDLDLRRADVFAREGDEGVDGKPPAFDDRRQPTRYALAQSSFLVRMFPDETRKKMLEERVRLSAEEERQAQLRAAAFGDRNAQSFRDAVLASKKRSVDQYTTGEYAKRHFPALHKSWLFLKRIHLFDIFESWWFYSLLGLIAVNVTVGTFARAPWNLRDFGLVVTHAGVLIILAGALLDRLVSREGYIYFTYGRPEKEIQSSIFDQKDQLYTNLPFRVKLDRFATEYYHELAVTRYDHGHTQDAAGGEGGAGAVFQVTESFPVRAGVSRLFEGGKIRLTFEDYLPRVRVAAKVVDQAGGPLRPAIELGLYNVAQGGPNFLLHGNTEPWLFAGDATRAHLDFQGLRFEYLWASSKEEYDRLLQIAPIPDNGTLILRKNGQSATIPVSLRETRTVEVGGTRVKVDFLGIESSTADAENVNLDRKLQRTEQPVLVFRENDSQMRRVYRDDKDFTKDYDIEYRFDWPNPRDNGTYRIYRIVEGEGMNRVLVTATEAGAPSAVRVPAGGERLSLEEIGGFLAVEGAVRSAVKTREVREITDEEFLQSGGGAEDALLAAWGKVVLDGPYGRIEREMTPYDAPIFYGPPGEPPLYAFRVYPTEQARDWFSVLSVLDNQDHVVKTHTVQVNSPLRHGGYRFYQATAGTDEQGLGVSGISVTFQPGVNFMYVGYAVLTFGVCWIFFLKPILVNRWRARRRQEANLP